VTTRQAKTRPARGEAWEHQPGESAPAFEAFVAYRDMGPSRSTAKVARSLGKSKALIDGWSSKHSWGIRVHAYDANVDREHLLDMRELRRKAMKRNATSAALALQKFGQAVAAIDVNKVKAADIAAIARVAVQMEQQVYAAAALPSGGAVSASGAVDADTIAGMTDEERRARLKMLVREASERLEDGDAIHDGMHDADDPEEE
jgi:hypothetical protein